MSKPPTLSDNPVRWKCAYCGHTNESANRKKAKHAYYTHRKRYHPETIGDYNVKPITETSEALTEIPKLPCGERCLSWTGKTVCMSGNYVKQGEMRRCFRWDVAL